MTTGIGEPFSSFCVWALNALQNSMMLRPRWPSAGPIGGEGFAAPAGTCNFRKPVTFFAMSHSLRRSRLPHAAPGSWCGPFGGLASAQGSSHNDRAFTLGLGTVDGSEKLSTAVFHLTDAHSPLWVESAQNAVPYTALRRMATLFCDFAAKPRPRPSIWLRFSSLQLLDLADVKLDRCLASIDLERNRHPRTRGVDIHDGPAERLERAGAYPHELVDAERRRPHHSFSTWANSSQPGVARPKIDPAT